MNKQINMPHFILTIAILFALFYLFANADKINWRKTAGNVVDKYVVAPVSSVKENIAVYDNSKIYQNNDAVATVAGKLVRNGDELVFETIDDNTGNFNKDQLFLFEGKKYKVISDSGYNESSVEISDLKTYHRIWYEVKAGLVQ